MGEQKINTRSNISERKRFLKQLINDVEALDLMIKKGFIENDIQRIGAEQEFALVNENFKPSKNAAFILNKINDAHFTSELALYNLEINLDPFELKDQCFNKMEKQLRSLLKRGDSVAAGFGDKIILSGILPSIDLRSVKMDFMTPNPRYYALGEIIKELRGQDFELNITGVDELILAHTNILFEACNTSFQCHLQVSSEEFVDQYNWAQLISGPVLSVCTNSPLMFGRELWSETRVPLFQQSIDIRSKGYYLREKQQRVSFGSDWINNITQIYKDDIARFTLILTNKVEEDSLKVLANGGIPELKALRLHNGTIWKWNRPCYGVGGGVPHLRIENRYIPSGPTVLDEIANLTFWVGLMKAMPDMYKGSWKNRVFEDAKENFYKAATAGIQSSMIWDNDIVPARKLVVEVLIPMAKTGLAKAGISQEEYDRYLQVIEARASLGKDGSRWLVNSFRKLKNKLGRDDAMVTLTAALHKRRLSQKPVHEWKPAEAKEMDKIPVKLDWIGSVMSTDLITVQETDLVELVEKIMEWRNIRHIPVEDSKGNLKGLISRNQLRRHYINTKRTKLEIVKDIMKTDLVTITIEADIKYAMLLMINKQISCLPVVEGNQLIGLITDTDTNDLWQKLMGNTIMPQIKKDGTEIKKKQ